MLHVDKPKFNACEMYTYITSFDIEFASNLNISKKNHRNKYGKKKSNQNLFNIRMHIYLLFC